MPSRPTIFNNADATRSGVGYASDRNGHGNVTSFAIPDMVKETEKRKDDPNLALWRQLTTLWLCRSGIDCKNYRPGIDDPERMFCYHVYDDHYRLTPADLATWVPAIRQGRAAVDNPPPVDLATERALAAPEEYWRERDEDVGQIDLNVNVNVNGAAAVNFQGSRNGHVNINIHNFSNIPMVPPHYQYLPADAHIIHAPPYPMLPYHGMDPRSQPPQPPPTTIAPSLPNAVAPAAIHWVPPQ
ncbi:uncharacterized protein B0T15DRAFT_570631 [Chaetomium strumarium]|uniref:Uncharacterized protein n=1 Tax=Chaetomium strumarium TaxID=1170767 RepID=A0AAJ0M5L7_9PEZI|nr:hypothetical protein B0T15DRAFT_570631 [Chaetomium strumarium]